MTHPAAHPPAEGREARIRTLFQAAIDAAPDARRALLDRARADQPSTCAEVESLLTFHDRAAGGVLDRSAADAASSLGPPAWRSAADAQGPALPARIGRYTVVREIGRGGMGVVYEAEQEFPRRRVALKVLRPELVTPSLLRRFTHEVEALAILRHPGIAPLYEAGFADEPARQRPFMAMELVEGRPITAHARERSLPVRARVELMARVCDAVEHAHLRGVIHRDLKPANILVSERAAGGNGAGPGDPKVLDFGVARITASRTGDSIATSAGQIIGTLGYMSPEQVAGDPRAIDARADVYALGAILYELLADRPALDASGLSLAEAALALRERTPEPLARIDTGFRGDLDTITSKALEKDPARRYQSPAALADDLRRYLAGEPIAARRDSAMYVMRKRLRQYRWGVGAAAAFLVLLTVFAAWASVQAGRFRTLAISESTAKAAAASNADALATQLRASNIERARLLVASGAAPDGESLLWSEHARRPEAMDTRWALRDTYAHYPCRATLEGHESPTDGVAFSPDGSLLVTGDRAGILKVWDARTHECLRTIDAQAKSIRSIAILPDNRTAWVSGADGVLRRCDLNTGAVAASIPAHGPSRFAIAVSPDGALLCTGGVDIDGGSGRTVRLWDARTGAPLADLGRHPQWLGHAAFSPDGLRLATTGADGVRLWDLESRTLVAQLPGEQFPGVECVAFDDTGLRLAGGGSTGVVTVWDVRTLKPIATIADSGAWAIRSVAFRRDNRGLVFANFWNLLTCDAVDRARPRELGVSSAMVHQFAISADRVTLATTGADRAIRLWEVGGDGPCTWIEPPIAGYLNMVTAAHDGTLAVVNETGIINFWTAGGVHIGDVPGKPGRVFDITFSADGARVACGRADGRVQVWDRASRTLLADFKAHATLANLRFSPDGSVLATCGTDGFFRLWNTAGWTARTELFRTGASETRMARFTPDGQLVLVNNRVGVVHFIDPATGAVLDTLSDETPCWGLDISPDGTRFALGDGARTVRVYDLATRRVLLRLEGHHEIVWSVAFSSDGALLASESADGMIKLWDAATGRGLITLTSGDQGILFPLQFIPGSHRLVTGHGFRGAAIWDFDHFDRFIAGNAAYQLGRLGWPEPALAAARDWAAGIGKR